MIRIEFDLAGERADICIVTADGLAASRPTLRDLLALPPDGSEREAGPGVIVARLSVDLTGDESDGLLDGAGVDLNAASYVDGAEQRFLVLRALARALGAVARSTEGGGG
jgi:hypothetical protein